MSIRRAIRASMLIGFALSASTVFSSGEIRIAHVYDKTGLLEAYANQTHTGLLMGLRYATGGTMTVAGKKIVVIERDSKGKPDLGKSQLAAAYEDDKADLAVGATSSGVALAMLPVAEEYKKILIVEPAVADSITGSAWNRYIFRTGRNSTQDAISNALALDEPGLSVATLAQDSAFGRDGVKAFKESLSKSTLVHEEFLPAATTDFTAAAQRLIAKLKGRPGRKVVWVLWAGAGNPFKVGDPLKAAGIELATGGNILPALALYKPYPGMQGATYYYYAIPKNPVNDALVAEHQKLYKSPPDFFTAGGFSAAMAIVTALKATNGDTNTETLIKTMKGMKFQTPKGEMVFRPEDHQALQSMYHFKIKVDDKLPWAIPELVREIKPAEMKLPLRNKR